MVSNVVTVGVVAYDPKVVTIWEGIKSYFTENGVATDYILFSNYDAQVDALLAGWIDIAWNTNLAYVKVHRRSQGKCGVLAMRDTDVGFTTTIVAGKTAGIEKLADLKGKRFALGSRDSGQASILPLYFLKREGFDPARDLSLLRFDLDVGKHGDTGTSEVEVLKAVASGEAHAGAMGDQYWARALSENLPESAKARAIWTSPGYCHCNFTVRTKDDEQRFAQWTETLLAMDYNRPADRKIMDMEGLKKWIRPQMDGYDVMFKAVDDLKFFND
jgi:ABC-type phosphate/phosphonate transport system substrate-binding protein